MINNSGKPILHYRLFWSTIFFDL